MPLQTAESCTLASEQQPIAQAHRLSTIVADDSDTFLEIVCALLERENNVDIVARGREGAEAIELVEKFRPDLLVMDIDTPHLDGLNAALIISTRFPSTGIILMSTEESRELRADCSAFGAVAFIYKPHFRDDFPVWLEALGASRSVAGSHRA